MELIDLESRETTREFLDEDSRGDFAIVDADELRLLCHESLDQPEESQLSDEYMLTHPMSAMHLVKTVGHLPQREVATRLGWSISRFGRWLRKGGVHKWRSKLCIRLRKLHHAAACTNFLNEVYSSPHTFRRTTVKEVRRIERQLPAKIDRARRRNDRGEGEMH